MKYAKIILFLTAFVVVADHLELGNDYDGKQVVTQLECLERGVKTTEQQNGTFWQTELVCQEPTKEGKQ